MFKRKRLVLAVLASAFAGGVGASGEARAGAFAVREQSTYFLGSEFAGAAAGGDISSMFWNPAATAAAPGFNTSSNYTAIIGRSDVTATGGLFVTGNPFSKPPIQGLGPDSTDIGTDAIVPASYATYQLSDQLFAGLAINSPFGFTTKPDDKDWPGSPFAVTSKVFSVDINPTLAYKLTPDLTIGAGVQVEYFKLRLNHAAFQGVLGSPTPFSGARSFSADDWGVGATAGVIWQPQQGTSIGLGYRSAVEEDVGGRFIRGAGLMSPPPVNTHATGSLTLPDEVTLSARQNVTQRLVLLGTVEWQDWSRIGNVSATSPGCPGGVCETLHLNYRDGWFFSAGAEYAYSPALTLRAGVGFERSPIQDSTRDIILPDSDRVHVGVGASYKYSDKISVELGYSHVFFEDGASFCIAASATGGATHCGGGAPVLLQGKADVAADLVSVGLNYHIGGPREPLK